MPVHLLFARTRWARRRGVAALTRGRRDAAYVMGTWRKREQLVRELGQSPTGTTRFVEPPAWVFGHLCDELVRRFVDDRAALPPGAAVAATWRFLKERREPSLGEELATAVALNELSDAWAGEGRVPDDPALRGWILGQRAVLDRLTGHRRLPERLRRLHDALRDPPDGLRRWLAQHPLVVVDDLCGLSELESAVVTALCSAWSDEGATVILSFAVGRSRGGREVAIALGVEPPEDREGVAFQATRKLRSRVFEDLVATGLAECWTAGPLGVQPVELTDEDGPAAPADLADHAASGVASPAPLPPGGLTAGSHPDRESEATWVARTLADLLQAGVDPADTLIAVADPASEPSLTRILTDHGVPWSRGGGLRPGWAPAVRAAVALLGLAVEGWPLDDVVSFAEFTRFARPGLLARLRAAGVRSGDPTTWEPALRSWSTRSRASLAGLLAERDAVQAGLALLPPHDPADGAEWANRLAAAWSGLPVDDPALNDAITEVHATIGRDLVIAGGVWEAPEVYALLGAALGALAVTPADDGVARVPVVGVREILGLTPRHTFLVGLRAGAWVSPRTRGPLSPDPGIGRDALAEARYLLHSLLRDAVSEPWMRGVHLSWPATVDGRPQRPAPILAEVLELRVGTGVLAELLVPPSAPEMGSRSGSARAAARGGPSTPFLDRVVAVAVARQHAPADYDGWLGRPIPPPGSLPVTTLETYLQCPQRYWVRHRLHLDVLPGDDPELEPRRRGTALHRILEEFLRARELRPVSADPDLTTARVSLHEVASRVLDEVEAEGGFDPLFHGYARSRWLAGLVDDRPSGLLRVWLDQERDRVGSAPVAVERSFGDLPVGPILLRGTLDRVDALSSGVLVVDYKTGRPPTREQVLAGLSLQPFAYLATVPAPAAACFQVLSRPDRLVRTTFVGDAAALDAACTPGERTAARVVPAEARAEVMTAAGARAAALLRGEFPPTPHDPALAGCAVCAYRSGCRRDHRHQTR